MFKITAVTFIASSVSAVKLFENVLPILDAPEESTMEQYLWNISNELGNDSVDFYTFPEVQRLFDKEVIIWDGGRTTFDLADY